MKKILLIATGGTIASRYTESGLSPQISGSELLSFVPEAKEFCKTDVISPFNLDSTNVRREQWLDLCKVIEDHYERYDGFVICHGTDTMAYTAAALSYLIQNSKKPIVITGAQRPIDLPVTDARTNLLDSLRFAAHEKAHDVCIVFNGQVIAGTRAKKERTQSYNAFSSINYPPIAVIQEKRIVFYIDDINKSEETTAFYHDLNSRVFLYKLIPGSDGKVLKLLLPDYDALIIESFGVGGIPSYGEDSIAGALKEWKEAGKIIVMSTQVTNEGSDMSVYQVGHTIKDILDLPESYDMTLESTVTKVMWILSERRNPEDFKRMFYKTVNHDILFSNGE
ncbi:MAG: asparaginase [Lachnospiraceae bacterium]|nr:asparaginase [Lachnospiraceae bacterium]